MRLKYYSKNQLNKDILKILGKYLNLDQYQVFYFGSRVAGFGDERSDVDLGIQGSKSVNPVILLKIKEEIENLPTLYKIDVVDINKSEPKFQKVALKKIEPLNG